MGGPQFGLINMNSKSGQRLEKWLSSPACSSSLDSNLPAACIVVVVHVVVVVVAV